MNTKDYLEQGVKVIIDRPLGSKHPKHGFTYTVNYGFVPGTKAPDGEELDAYLLGVDEPVNTGVGKCIAIIHRTNDADDKLIISANGKNFTNEEIENLTKFQEKWFKHEIIRK